MAAISAESKLREKRGSLRILLKESKVKKSDAKRAKAYRQRLKEDPSKLIDYKNKNKIKCQRYRRNLTLEQLDLQREKSRLRIQKYRQKKKNEKALEPAKTPKPAKRPKTRDTVAAQRKQWAESQKAHRATWSSEKWRRFYEKCADYRQRKRSDEQAAQMQTPKAPRSHTISSPSPRRLKSAYKEQLSSLRNLRHRDALARKNLMHSLVDYSIVKKINLYSKSTSDNAKAAQEFLINEAVDLPNKRTVSRKGRVQRKILTKRVKRLHTDFCKRNPDKKVSLRTFYRVLPKHMLTSHKHKFQQCLCEYCTNVDLKLDKLNMLLGQNEIDGKDSLSEQSLCTIPTLECYDRICTKCGVEKVRGSILQHVKNDEAVTWEIWEMVEVERGGKRREKVQKQGDVGGLVEELMTELQPFSKHLLNFRWQYQQLRQLQSRLPSTWALAMMDFSENFLCKLQKEVQSAHWGYNQVTVHPCVLYYKCPFPNCTEQVIDSLVFLSDDLSHDAHMVKVIHEKIKHHLKSSVTHLKKIVTAFDGCSAQYKSKVTIHYFANEDQDIAIERCYYGSRHGKNACDAVGGVVK